MATTTITFDQINNLDLGPSKYFDVLEDAYGGLDIGTPLYFSEICKNLGLGYGIYALMALPESCRHRLMIMCCEFALYRLNKLDSESSNSVSGISFLKDKVRFIKTFKEKEINYDEFSKSKESLSNWRKTYKAANFKNEELVNLITCLHSLNNLPIFSISHHLSELKDDFLEELIIKHFG